MAVGDEETCTDKAGITTKVKPTIEMSYWVQHVQETKLWLTVVHILVLATFIVSEIYFQTWGAGDALYTSDSMTTARQL